MNINKMQTTHPYKNKSNNMESLSLAHAKEILTDYLETSDLRKTPERYAVLKAIYSFEGHFKIEELGKMLEENNFRVSRATLYNTMKLFLQLRLVMQHRVQGKTWYEAKTSQSNHCHQICTVCGKVTEIELPEVIAALNRAKLSRFRKDGFALYIYGTCSSCQAKITRRKNMK